MYKRSIILTENEKVILRNDISVNGYNNIEMDVFQFILLLDKTKGILNSKKLMNMLKVHHGMNISDVVDVFVNSNEWKINQNKIKE